MTRKILSDFHYTQLLIDGKCLASMDAFHDELSLKLGLPQWYNRTWERLQECLSSIGSPKNNLCRHWEWRNGKRLVLSIHDFSQTSCDADVHLRFLTVVATANAHLASTGGSNRIWIDYVA